MITLNRYSEYQYNNRPEQKNIYVLGKSAVIKENRGSWQSGLLFESGDIAWISTYNSRTEVFNNIAKDIVQYIGHTYQPIYENFSPDWIKGLSDDIVAWHNGFFDLGILQSIQPYADGIELEYTDSVYSEDLDDLGVDHTLDTELYIDIVFRGISEDTERLISLGLQDVPDDYEIQIFVEYSSSNKSIFGFSYTDSKKWYFDKSDLENIWEESVNGVIKWCITELVTEWVKKTNEKSLNRLVKLATSVKKNRK